MNEKRRSKRRTERLQTKPETDVLRLEKQMSSCLTDSPLEIERKPDQAFVPTLERISNEAAPDKSISSESVFSNEISTESSTDDGSRFDDKSSTGDEPPIDWAKALKENESWLRTVIAARVGEAAAVEEVFQEVSLAAIRQKSPIQDRTKIGPWLYRLAITQSLLYRRTMGRKRKLVDRYTEQVPIVEYDPKQIDPLNWLMNEERNQMVKKAIDLLPRNQKELLYLKYVHDWSYKEMADKTGLTVSAIQSKLHRARGQLREKLTQTFPEETWAPRSN